MNLTLEQLRTIDEALSYSCHALSEEFEQHRKKEDAESVQNAVKSYGKLRRFNRLLTELRRLSLTYTHDTPRNNVLMMIANRR